MGTWKKLVLEDSSPTIAELDVTYTSTFGGVTTHSDNVIITKAVNPYLYINDTTGAKGIFQAYDTYVNIGSDSNHELRIVQNNATAITIDTSKNATFAGNITTTGGQLLTTSGVNLALNPNTGLVTVGGSIQASSSQNVYLSLDTTQTNGDEWKIFNVVSGSDSQLQFKNEDATEYPLVLQEGGLVGINTVSPTHVLDIYGGSLNATGGIKLTNDDTGVGATDGTTLMVEQNSGRFILRQYEDANILIRTNDTDAIEIDNSQKATFSGNVVFNGSQFDYFRAVNSGNPEFHMGSSDTNKLHIQTVYTSSAQTLNYVTFTTKSSLTSADAGKMEFWVDEAQKLIIDDGGLEVVGSVIMNEANDGGTTEMIINNSAAGGSTDEKVGIRLRHAGTTSASIYSGRDEAFSGSSSYSGNLIFNVNYNDTLTERLKIQSGGEFTFTGQSFTFTPNNGNGDVSFGGDVGIGTSSPDSQFHLHGSTGIRLTDSNQNANEYAEIKYDNAGSTNLYINNDWTNSNAEINFQLAGSTKMKVIGSGSVKIGDGTGTAGHLSVEGLSIARNDTYDSYLSWGRYGYHLWRMAGSDYSSYVYTTNWRSDGSSAAYRESIRFYNNGNLTLTGSENYGEGRLGIGTNSPSRPLHIKTSAHTYLRIQSADTAKNSAIEFFDGTNYFYSGFMANESGVSAGEFSLYTGSSVAAMVVAQDGSTAFAGTVGVGHSSVKIRGDANYSYTESTGGHIVRYTYSGSFDNQFLFISNNFYPNADNVYRCGKADYYWKEVNTYDLHAKDDITVDGDATVSGHIVLPDASGSGGVLKLGASEDIQIYHDGSHSYLDHLNTGDLYIRNLRHGGSIKFHTEKSDGTQYTPLVLDDAGNATFSGQYLVINAGGTNSAITTNSDTMHFIADTNDNGGENPFEWWHNSASIDGGTKLMHLTNGKDLWIGNDLTTTGSISVPDGQKVGAGDDKDIWMTHSTHSYIENKTGELRIVQSSGDHFSIWTEPSGGSDTKRLNIAPDGVVTIYGNTEIQGTVTLDTGEKLLAAGGYLVADGDAGFIARDSGANKLIVNGDVVRGDADKVQQLGLSNVRWLNIFSGKGNFSDAVTLNGHQFLTTTISNFDADEWFHACKVTGSQLNNVIKMTLKGVSTSGHLHSHVIDIMVNHYQDIQLKSWNGDYSQLKIKVVSDGNENFDVFLKKATAGTYNHDMTLEVNIQVLTSNTIVEFGSEGGYSGNTLEHTTTRGISNAGLDGSTYGRSRHTQDGEMRVGSGTLAAPSYSFKDDTDTGMYRNESNGLVFVTGGSQAMSFNSSQTAVFSGDVYIPANLVHSGDGNNYIGFQTDRQDFVTDGTTALTIDSSQTALFYGTIIRRATNNSAGIAWTVIGDGNIPHISIQNASTTDDTMAGLFFKDDQAHRAGIHAKFTSHTDSSESAELIFSTTTSGNTRERMTIGGDGDVSIVGSTNYSQLRIKGAGDESGIKFIDSGGTTDGFIYAQGTDIGFLEANGSWKVRHANSLSQFYNQVNITSGALVVTAANDTAAYVYIQADNNDNNADNWRLSAETDGMFDIQSRESGSWASVVEWGGSDKALYAKGNVYLSGTTLSLAGTASVDSYLRFDGGGGDTYLHYNANDIIDVYTGGDVAMRIKDNDIECKGAITADGDIKTLGAGHMLALGDHTTNGSPMIQFQGTDSNYNWRIRQNDANGGDFTIKRSTATGGTTFETVPAMQILADETIKFNGQEVVTSGGQILGGHHGYATRIKVLPFDFIPNDDSNTDTDGIVSVDGEANVGKVHVTNSNIETHANYDIPRGYKVTHCMLYGSDTGNVVKIYEANIDDDDGVEKGSGNIGTEIDCTDFDSSATNYVVLKWSPTSTSDYLYGGYITIAKM